MPDSSSLSSLIAQSNVLTVEKKQIYTQILPYLSAEASSQLEVLLSGAEAKVQKIREQEEAAISDINIKASEDMKELVRVELKAIQAQAEVNESTAAESLLTKLDNL